MYEHLPPQLYMILTILMSQKLRKLAVPIRSCHLGSLAIITGPVWFSILNAYRGKFDIKLFVNSLRPRLNIRPLADDIFKCIFLNENEWILPRISLKFVPKVRINNIPSLIQIMAWRRPGDKPLSEPMMVSLLTHICVTRPQWPREKENVILKTKPWFFKILL